MQKKRPGHGQSCCQSVCVCERLQCGTAYHRWRGVRKYARMGVYVMTCYREELKLLRLSRWLSLSVILSGLKTNEYK